MLISLLYIYTWLGFNIGNIWNSSKTNSRMGIYKYFKYMGCLYCRIDNPNVTLAETYIHSSGNTFLIRKVDKNWVISRRKDGTDVILRKSEMRQSGLEWEYAQIFYKL